MQRGPDVAPTESRSVLAQSGACEELFMVKPMFSLMLLSVLAACAEGSPSQDPRDAMTEASVPDTARDAGLDARATACADERAFFETHRACARDEDCVIVGACSGGFGFKAVQSSAQTEAQGYSDRAACGPVFDGPTYNAVCENAQCFARNNGRQCGMPADAAVCPLDQELYATNCDGGMNQCRQRCAGEADPTCGGSKVCARETVSQVGGPYGLGCVDELPTEVWLCR